MHTTYSFQFNDRILAAGQPSPIDVAKLAAQGFSTVINLRSEPEMMDLNEAAWVHDQGMDYMHMPIADAADVTQAHARSLDAMIRDARPGKILIHCASANRVGALLALRAFYCQDASPADAMSCGISAGMMSLSSHVEALLTPH